MVTGRGLAESGRVWVRDRGNLSRGAEEGVGGRRGKMKDRDVYTVETLAHTHLWMS